MPLLRTLTLLHDTWLIRGPLLLSQFDGSTLHARSVEASLGKTGVLRAHGALPVQPLPSPASATPSSPAASGPASNLSESARALGDALAAMRGVMGIPPAASRVDPGVSGAGDARSSVTASGCGSNGVVLEVENAEVRARGVYSGLVDARLVLSRSLVRPTLGGKLRFSKGVAYLIPPAQQQDKVGVDTAHLLLAELYAVTHRDTLRLLKFTCLGVARSSRMSSSFPVAEVEDGRLKRPKVPKTTRRLRFRLARYNG